jgi:hypothetical protein
VITAVLLVIAGLLLLSACGVDVGPAQELAIDEPLTGAAVTDVRVAMGAGKLSVSAGAGGLASGVIRYNVTSWKPSVSQTDDSLTIRQGSQKGLSGLGTDILNEWTLKLGASPLRLNVTAGAYEGTYELGGLTLEDLSIKDGAAKTKVNFGSPNPGQIGTFSYETGASKVSMTGLANANFENMSFKGGAGSYSLDFSGDLRSDAVVVIKAGVGTVEIVVPADTAAVVTVDGALNDVNLDGDWTSQDKTHRNPAAMSDGARRTLSISVDMSVGTLKLVTE